MKVTEHLHNNRDETMGICGGSGEGGTLVGGETWFSSPNLSGPSLMLSSFHITSSWDYWVLKLAIQLSHNVIYS